MDSCKASQGLEASLVFQMGLAVLDTAEVCWRASFR